MPDLLAHALVAYALGTALSWRYDWMRPPYVTAVMAGAFIPDLTKVQLVVSSVEIRALFGVPFSWDALHFGGGVLLSVLIGVLLAAPRTQRRVGITLALGAGSHVFLDALLRTPSGFAFPVFWPLTRYRPPTPGLYLSTSVWPTIAALAIAAVVYGLTEWQGIHGADDR